LPGVLYFIESPNTRSATIIGIVVAGHRPATKDGKNFRYQLLEQILRGGNARFVPDPYDSLVAGRRDDWISGSFALRSLGRRSRSRRP